MPRRDMGESERVSASGEWAIGGKPLTTADVKAVQSEPP